MHQMTSWPDAAGFFDALNKNCRYAVLRNHEDYFSSLSLEGHADIDMICDDEKALAKVAGAVMRRKLFINPWNLSVSIAGNTVELDVYSPGSRYYDPEWTALMLDNRVYDERGFYRLSDQDYYYSLMYHAAIHKPVFGEDYMKRLSEMSGTHKDEALFRMELEQYMKAHGYRYTYPYPYPPKRFTGFKNVPHPGPDVTLPVLFVVYERAVERKLRSIVNDRIFSRKKRV